VLGLALAFLVASGLGARALAAALDNLGAVELNRATVSEETARGDRPRLLERSTRLLRLAADLDGENSTVQRTLALALAAQGDMRRARSAAEQARAATAPTDQYGQFQVGRAFAAIGTWADVIEAWEAANAGPQLLQLGFRLQRARNWDQTIAAFTAAAIVEPDSRTAYEGIAKSAIERGDSVERTIALLQPLIERGSWNEYYARLQMAHIYREAGRPHDALEMLGPAARIARTEELALERGLALAQLGRWEEAEPSLRDATRHLPEKVDAWYWFGLVEARLAKFDAAIAAAREGLGIVSADDTTRRGAFHALIGESLLGLGRPAEALASFEDGAGLLPGHPRLTEGIERARAAGTGQPVTLVVNGGFERDGDWRIVPEGAWSGSDLGSRDHPGAGDRAAAIAAGPTGTRYASQEVRNLRPGATYRVTARARAAGLALGAATVRAAAVQPRGRAADAPREVYASAGTRSLDWMPIELTFVAPHATVAIELGFPDGAEAGAVAWFDEVALTEIAPG
jgi:tetratricopeptide (TPR) repeat protein